MVSGQPGDGVPSRVLVFKSLLELLEKVIPGSEGYGCVSDGVLPEGICPGQSRPFGHIQEGEGDFLRVCVVRSLIDYEVELDGVHPQDSHFIGAIEGFGFAELEFSRFDSG